MAQLRDSIAGFRGTDSLQSMLEAALAPTPPADGASASTLFWNEWTVTGADGITREKSGGVYDIPLTLPSLQDAKSAELRLIRSGFLTPDTATLEISLDGANCSFKIEAAEEIIEGLWEDVVEVLRQYIDPDLLPKPPLFKVFIGHGGDPQWKYLHRALNRSHGIVAEAFESSERAGYHTLVVVDQLVRSSAVAVVIMTGEDLDDTGNLRARENVVHEVGFCQGALGIENTIIVLEEHVSEPSNIAGLTQIRFSKGRLIDVEDRIVEVLQQRRQVFDYRES